MNSLDRALGCFVGAAIGDALGAYVEFSETVTLAQVDVAFEMPGGGPHRLGPGQVTDDTEMAVAAAQALVSCDLRDADGAQTALLNAYRDWAATKPFGLGQTCARALLGPRLPLDEHLDRVRATNWRSRANGATMRASALIVAFHKTDAGVREMARRDAELTHPEPFCVDGNEAYASAVAALIRGESPVFKTQKTQNAELSPVLEGGLPDSAYESMGWVGYALAMTAHFLKTGASFEDAMRGVLLRGGDTDTNAAIVGAALGAKYGLSGLPTEWVDAVMNASADDKRRRPAWISPRGKLFVVRHLHDIAI